MLRIEPVVIRLIERIVFVPLDIKRSGLSAENPGSVTAVT